ncbi:MAG: porin family protein [Janthinobacterium lividum]
MRKTILLLALGLGLSTAAQAQYRGRGGNVSLGIKAGASLTDFVGADAQDVNGHKYGNRFGFHAGVFANIGFSKLLAFQPEILYSQKGAKTDDVDQRFRLHYVDVPLVFHVNTDGFFLEAGPQVGFLLAAKQEVGNTSADINSYKTVDFGYVAGLGYQLKHGPGLGLRYNGAFTNFPQANTAGSLTVQNRVRNSALQLYLTYSFN